MLKGFNTSERGDGPYWPLAILRWVMVLIFISFGITAVRSKGKQFPLVTIC